MRGPAREGRPGPSPSRRGGTVRTLLGRLLPPACVVCGASLPPETPPLCTPCGLRLPSMAPPRCDRCGATATARSPGGGCGECREWDDRAPRCRAPFRMEGAAARVVRALKYAGWTRLSDAMADAMAHGARELAGEEGALLVPVPLAPGRRRERGYNQAELLARSLAGVTGWPVRPLLARRSGGRAQAVLGRAGRRDNVSGAFRLADGRGGEGRVLVVDDVITTGATIRACASALSSGGLRPVGAVAFARTLPPLHGA